MPWRFSRAILLARRRFEGGDPLPDWLADRGMVLYITRRWPGLLCDDTTAAPPGPATPAPPPEHDEEDRVTQEQLAASWAEWQEVRERLEPVRGGEDEEEPDDGHETDVK